MQQAIKKDERDFHRIEGAYAQWITEGDVTLLEIERVNGDCTVTRMVLTMAELRAVERVIRRKCVSASCI